MSTKRDTFKDMKTRRYKVSSRTSTVNGGPGRYYDWSKFCWDGSEIYLERCFIPGHPVAERKAPLPYPDGFLNAPGCQYLHVPYNWAEASTIYRVRPNDTMYTGATYRGRLVKQQRAILLADGWYWELDLE